jgi:HPt (histidine-containing phosphotransfer) domain-containing protein
MLRPVLTTGGAPVEPPFPIWSPHNVVPTVVPAAAPAVAPATVPAVAPLDDEAGSPAENRLVSELADDPDLGAIIPEFLAGLAARREELQTAVAAGDRARLRTLAHQLKGAAGGFGYPTMGEAAAALETATKNPDTPALQVTGRAHDLRRLIDAARRAAP